jgi:signal transduction histidine kinase
VEVHPLHMQLVVEDALNRLAPLIERFGAEIQMPETWPVSLGYGPWVEQVWINYLGNAIRYGGRPEDVEIVLTYLP